MKILRLGVSYGAPPIFNPDPEEMGHVEFSDLQLSPLLLAKLAEWDKEFQKTFSDEYPPDSGFARESDYDKHNSRGYKLAALLEEELGEEVTVEFVPISK